MNENYYKKNDMINISILVTLEMKAKVEAKAQKTGESMQKTYAGICSDFVSVVKSEGVHNILFSRPFKRINEKNNAQFWVPRELGEEIKSLAAEANVTIRSFCYTAMLYTFKKNRK